MKEKIESFIYRTAPPGRWKVPVIIISGVLTGLVLLVMYIGNATSYLSDKPETCINCHVMYPQYSSWQHSSHGRFATCNDCHVPQTNIVEKYLFKASDGLRHSTMFTFRLEPQVIRIKEAGADVVQKNCMRCHEKFIDRTSLYHGKESLEKKCWTCHEETPHGTVSSLSSFPATRVPQLNPVVPDWIRKNFIKE